MLGELAVGFRLDVEARAARHVIGNDRRMDGDRQYRYNAGSGLLGGFVIIGSNDEQTINSCFFRFVGEVNGICRIIAARAGNHRNTVCRVVDRKLNRPGVLLMCEG